jgi:hypothetical protein
MMKITFTNGSATEEHVTELDEVTAVDVMQYAPGALDGYSAYPGLLPQMSKGDIILCIVDDNPGSPSSLRQVINLTHTQFENVRLQS